jgi:DNA invertase Pin-like site-specific DNA recombinase
MTATKSPQRPAAYLRQSKDDELGITRQREDTVALCQRKGWPAPKFYVDNDASASNGKTREHYRRMLTDIRAGKVDAVVVAQLDRLHRRPIELEEFITLADEKHLALACASGDVDLATDDGRFMARVMGAVARKEIERKSWRFARAAEQRAEAGIQWWAVRPFGYERKPVLDGEGKPVHNKHGKPMWEPAQHPVEALAIKDAYSAVLGGVSLYRLTADWNARGLKTPRGNPWRGAQLRALLLSPRNAGLRSFRGDVLKVKEQPVTGNWDAIVPVETWQAVADKLGDPKRCTGRSRARKHLLSNIAVCSECGSRMGSGVTKRPKQNPIYTCKVCNKVSRSAAFVDELATEAVIRRLSQPDAIELVQPEDRDDLGDLRERARTLRARLDGMAVEFADGDLTPSQLKTATKRINEQLAQIDQTITDSQSTHVFDGLIGVDDVAVAFNALSLDRRRAVIDTLLTITISPSGRCGRVFKREDVDVVFR